MGSGRDADLAPELQQWTKHVEQPWDEMVPGGPEDGVVERDVPLREAPGIAEGIVEDGQGALHRLEVRRGRARSGERSGLDLDHPAQLEQLQEDVLDRPDLAPR